MIYLKIMKDNLKKSLIDRKFQLTLNKIYYQNTNISKFYLSFILA